MKYERDPIFLFLLIELESLGPMIAIAVVGLFPAESGTPAYPIEPVLSGDAPRNFYWGEVMKRH